MTAVGNTGDDGVYNFGKTITLNKPIHVKSVNGRSVTSVSGGNAHCPFKLNHAASAIVGCTLAGGRLAFADALIMVH